MLNCLKTCQQGSNYCQRCHNTKATDTQPQADEANGQLSTLCHSGTYNTICNLLYHCTILLSMLCQTFGELDIESKLKE